ncbi:hypothetical protein J6590_091091, partial [Homalodisca vitripennis]
MQVTTNEIPSLGMALGNLLNVVVYLNFLRDELPKLLDDVPLHLRQNMWFMHDRAPAHYSLAVRGHLNESFTNQWIGRGGP